MYTHIYQNSYIVAIITFIVLSVIFYFLQIGNKVVMVNGKIVRKFNWKYPLAITLVVWIIWHFYIYPQATPNEKISCPAEKHVKSKYFTEKTEKMVDQKIIMNNWN